MVIMGAGRYRERVLHGVRGLVFQAVSTRCGGLVFLPSLFFRPLFYLLLFCFQTACQPLSEMVI